ncbi:MAG TPA: glycosyltransferase family 2 protein [Polyangia bacterium]|jgi:glycosyltransferase involved in cell wall biosynthesis
MYRGLEVAVVIPAFNEAAKIGPTLRSVPGFVDRVIVVDDASGDATRRTAQRSRRRGLEIVSHPRNRGVGAAIATGYRRALAHGADVAVVMAGDGQMDPADMPALLDPISEGRADYTKGNRFRFRSVWRVMPFWRLIGNIILSLLTKLTSGYFKLFDSQCGYTAVAARGLRRLDLDRLFPRYGYPNDVLARLRVAGCRVLDVPVRPVYGAAWRSGIRLRTAIYPIAYVLLRSLVWRATWALRGLVGRAYRCPDNVVSARRV